MQILGSPYALYVPQLMYIAHPDMQYISLYMLTFVKTCFKSKQKSTAAAVFLTFNGTSVDILLRFFCLSNYQLSCSRLPPIGVTIPEAV